jgi:hypothetical protein
MIASFSPHFMKSSFDIPNVNKKKKNKPRTPPSLFTQFYKRVNQIDRTSIEDTTYNEWNERTKLAEKLEGMKFKKKETIINNLVYEKDFSLDTLNILCTYYKVNLIYIKDRTFVKMHHADSEKPSWFMNDTHQFIDEVDIENYLEVTLEKPLKSVSYYLLPKLQDMSRRLLLPIENYKKQDLYNSIKQVLVKLYKIEE